MTTRDDGAANGRAESGATPDSGVANDATAQRRAANDAGAHGRAATVTFEHVTKRYAGRGSPAAVNDLNLSVPAGSVCVLVGPSGCGKTTSLKMVNRLIEPSSGRILIDGEDVARRDVTELRRGIGYVIQQVGLFPHETVGENVAVVPRLLGWSAGRRRERAEELLALVGLDPASYARRYPSELSGGERQRVGVARALAADPPLLLMDEPFGAVDPLQRARLQDELLRLQRDLAKTILFVTHDIDEAIKMGNLVAVMREGGTLAQFASPDELLAQPASDFVARFVGADRALKGLALRTVGELEPDPAVTASIRDTLASVRDRLGAPPPPWLVVVDEAGRPVGWANTRRGSDSTAFGSWRLAPLSPLLSPRTTLRDALSALFDAGVRSGIMVDAQGRPRGLVSIDAIADLVRASGAAADAGTAAAPVDPQASPEPVS